MRNQKTTIVILGSIAVAIALVPIYQSATALRREKERLANGELASSSDPTLLVGEMREFTYSQMQMAMPVRITVWCGTQVQAEKACKLAFRRVAELVKIFSDYDSKSEIARVVATGYESEIGISQELAQVLAFSSQLNRASDGAFDPTCGPVIQLWRTARRIGELPESAEIEKANRNVGFDKIKLDEGSCRLTLLAPEMQLDFGGIAKGFMGDQVMIILRENGIEIACFEAGGDIVLSGSPPGTAGWMIDVGAEEQLVLSNCGVSTSGDSQQFVNIGGKRYSHVIDPRTGIGVTTGRTAFVIAPSGMQSDALATTGCVLSEKELQTVLGAYEGVKGWSVLNDQ